MNNDSTGEAAPAGLRLALFVQEFPFPPMYGGLVDAWNRLLAFREQGLKICLVAWLVPGAQPAPDALARVMSVVDELVLLHYDSSPTARAMRLMQLPLRPIAVSARMSPKEGLGAVADVLARFAPDAIWADQWTMAPIAAQFARKFRCHWYLRSHNVEHVYQRLVAGAKPGPLARTKARLRNLGIERFETWALSHAHAFFDISIDDLAFWRQRGLTNGVWLGPVFPNPAQHVYPPPAFDVSFLGSLRTETNLSGLRWFYTEVVPVLRARRPDLSILINGHAPTEAARAMVAADPHSCLNADIADPRAAWNAGRVLINPVLEGSGVNIKSVEMLLEDRPLVGTPLAVRGLPVEAQRHFAVAAHAEDFAGKILKALDASPAAGTRQEEMRLLFGPGRIAEIVRQFRRDRRPSGLAAS